MHLLLVRPDVERNVYIPAGVRLACLTSFGTEALHERHVTRAAVLICDPIALPPRPLIFEEGCRVIAIALSRDGDSVVAEDSGGENEGKIENSVHHGLF